MTTGDPAPRLTDDPNEETIMTKNPEQDLHSELNQMVRGY